MPNDILVRLFSVEGKKLIKKALKFKLYPLRTQTYKKRKTHAHLLKASNNHLR